MKPRLVDQYTYQELFTAYLDCCRRKRNTWPAFNFDVDCKDNLGALLDEINSGQYVISPSRAFVVKWPKIREVWAAQFRDRIVHHLLYNSIAPFYQSRFIHTNCACIPGRGTLYAVNWVERYCREITQNWSKPAWVLQFDIKNFFVSIDRALLWSILARDLGETSLTSKLLKQIIFHDPTVDAIIKYPETFKKVPRHKSLLHAPKGKGLPIGDLSSQLCASGVYLNELDQFCKHILKVHYYVRYVDDAICLFNTKSEAQHCLDEITKWLPENLKLEISQTKSKIYQAKNGINFVGTYILPFRRYPRKMSITRAFQVAMNLRRHPLVHKYLDGLNSYLGLFKYTDSYNLRKKLCQIVGSPALIKSDRGYTKLYYVYGDINNGSL